MADSLEGRVFVAEENEGGEVGADTRFEYHQDGDLVWARYEGGSIRLGFLVGTRHGDRLEIRYSQVNTEGVTSTGRCQTEIDTLDDGRLRLREAWAWESRPGEGTSVMVEA